MGNNISDYSDDSFLLLKFERAWLYAIIITSISLRIFAILFLKTYDNPVTWESGAIADSIAGGRGFSYAFSGLSRSEPTSAIPPFYPYLMALFYKVFGKGKTTFLLLEILQAFAGGLMTIVIYKLSKKMFSRGVGILSSVLAALYPIYIWYSTRIHSMAFTLLIIPTIVLVWIYLIEKPSLKKACWLGTLTGVGALVDPVTLGFFPFIIVWAFAKLQTRDWLLSVSTVMATVVIILMPWTIRNYMVHNKLILIKSNFGKELWIGNNPDATGTAYTEGGRHEVAEIFYEENRSKIAGMDEIQLSTFMGNKARSWIVSHPAEFVKLSLKKAYWFVWFAPENLVNSGAGAPSKRYWIYQKILRGLLLSSSLVALFLLRKNTLVILPFMLVYASYVLTYSMAHVGQQRYPAAVDFVLIILSSYFLYNNLKKLAPNIAMKFLDT